MSRRLTGLAAVTVLLAGAWGLAPSDGQSVGEAQIGYSIYRVTRDELSAALIGGSLGGAAAYAGGEAGAKVGGFFGGIVGAAVGGVLGAL